MEQELFHNFKLKGSRTFEIRRRHDGRYNVWQLFFNNGSPQRHRVWQCVMVVDIPTAKELRRMMK